MKIFSFQLSDYQMKHKILVREAGSQNIKFNLRQKDD